jgi:monoamine oxidase
MPLPQQAPAPHPAPAQGQAPDPDLLDASLIVILDVLSQAKPDAQGLPDDEAWAKAQQVLDLLDEGQRPATPTPAPAPSARMALGDDEPEGPTRPRRPWRIKTRTKAPSRRRSLPRDDGPQDDHYGSEPPGPGWTMLSPGHWRKPTHDPSAPSICVIGGGPGGLFTTYILNQKLPSARVTILEASSRTGGKIFTDHFSDGTPFESGVAELYEYKGPGEKDPLRALIEDDLGLTTVNMSGGGVVLCDEPIRDMDDLEAQHGTEVRKQVEAFHRKMAKLMPLERYAKRWQPDNDHPWARETFLHHARALLTEPKALAYVATAVHSDLATEMHTCNGLNGIKNVLLDNDEYIQLYHVRGGIGKVAESLAEKIDADIQTDTRVLSVEKSDNDRYRVHHHHNGQRQDKEYDCVIFALPNHWLSQVRFPDAKLKSAIDAMLQHYDLPAHYLRVSLNFSHNWWEKFRFPGDFWMMEIHDGCCVYDESARWRSTRGHVLSFLLAGQAALNCCTSNQSDREIVNFVLDSLPLDWQDDAHETLQEAQVDRHVGSVNAQPGGWPAEELRGEHHPEPKDNPGIFLVCDAFFDSTLNAALMSASLAVELLCEELEIAPQKATPAIEALATVGTGV